MCENTPICSSGTGLPKPTFKVVSLVSSWLKANVSAGMEYGGTELFLHSVPLQVVTVVL